MTPQPLENLVASGVLKLSGKRYGNRSQAIELAVSAQLDRLKRRRLAEECAKADSALEQRMADEGLTADAAAWPDY
jgi:hypothetical protein